MTDTTSTSQTGFEFVLGGHKYNADDLTLLDVAELEDEFDETVEDLMRSGRMKPLLYMAWLIRRHTEPDVTLEDVGSPRLGDLVAEAEAAGGPPTKDAAPSRRSGGSGSRGSRGSTASGRGSSDS